jgi:hypothetical protein
MFVSLALTTLTADRCRGVLGDDLAGVAGLYKQMPILQCSSRALYADLI